MISIHLRLAWCLVFVGALIASTTGCSSSQLDTVAWEADTLTLYSIDGNTSVVHGSAPVDDREKFHGYPVLGQLNLQDTADRKAILQAIESGINGSDGSVAGCFIPRHGIRAVKGNDTIDYVICFQCMQILIYKNGVQSYVLTNAKPQPVLDALLKKANIPLAL